MSVIKLYSINLSAYLLPRIVNLSSMVAPRFFNRCSEARKQKILAVKTVDEVSAMMSGFVK